MIYGYARCSTNEDLQDIKRQVRELIQMGVPGSNIFKEYQSGTNVDRVELDRLTRAVGEGDCIITTEVSRITRSTKQLCEIVEFAKDKHIKLVFGNFVVDCKPREKGAVHLLIAIDEINGKNKRKSMESKEQIYLLFSLFA